MGKPCSVGGLNLFFNQTGLIKADHNYHVLLKQTCDKGVDEEERHIQNFPYPMKSSYPV